MQFWDFLHKNCISIRQKFVCHRLRIRFFQEVKIFESTSCEKRAVKVFQVFKVFSDQIPDWWYIAHTSLLTSTPVTRLILLLGKQAHILAKSAIFNEAVMSTNLRGPTSMLIFSNYIQLFTLVPVFNFLVISKQVLDGVILSPSKNKSLKYSPKLDKVFVNANQNPLSKKFRRFHLWSGLRSWKKKQFIRDFLFSKPINLGTSVRKTNRRSRNKERPKELRRKHYCSIKVPFHQSQHL